MAGLLRSPSDVKIQYITVPEVAPSLSALTLSSTRTTEGSNGQGGSGITAFYDHTFSPSRPGDLVGAAKRVVTVKLVLCGNFASTGCSNPTPEGQFVSVDQASGANQLNLTSYINGSPGHVLLGPGRHRLVLSAEGCNPVQADFDVFPKYIALGFLLRWHSSRTAFRRLRPVGSPVRPISNPTSGRWSASRRTGISGPVRGPTSSTSSTATAAGSRQLWCTPKRGDTRSTGPESATCKERPDRCHRGRTPWFMRSTQAGSSPRSPSRSRPTTSAIPSAGVANARYRVGLRYACLRRVNIPKGSRPVLGRRRRVPATPLSSRGLGRRPLTAETRVRIPVAVPTMCLQTVHFWAVYGGQLVANPAVAVLTDRTARPRSRLLPPPAQRIDRKPASPGESTRPGRAVDGQ